MSADILIVEDEMLIAYDVATTIRDLGHNVIGIAPDLETALSLADQPFDLALVDLNLRDGLTGPEIGRQLCMRHKCAVLFVTANPQTLGDGIAGTIGVLTKPADPEAMRQAIQYALNVHEGGDTTATPPDALRVFKHAAN